MAVDILNRDKSWGVFAPDCTLKVSWVLIFQHNFNLGYAWVLSYYLSEHCNSISNWF